nr:putative receptor-like protein kinase [Quercus suber]
MPFYKDYVVKIQKKGVQDNNHVVSIDLHPDTGATSDDAILNGVEVFKLSNPDGNLAGPSQMLPSLPAASTTKESKTKKTIFIAIGSGVGVLVFSIDQIKIVTDNFHQELIISRGGFGYVYKGFIDKSMIVAIKRLNPESRQGAREFRTEIEMLSQLRHGHLVSLIGYCNDEGEMILMYEYMANDFGLSKMGLDQTAVTTNVKGTLGYLDPDYARCLQVNEKIDVYSFGAVFLEVLCGRKAVNSKLGQKQLHLPCWARKCIENGTIYEIIDPYLKGKIAPECFKNADAEQEKINPSDDITDQEVRSFRVSQNINVHNVGPMLESETGDGLSTFNSGLSTNRSIDSDRVTGTSRDIFTNNSNATT